MTPTRPTGAPEPSGPAPEHLRRLGDHFHASPIARTMDLRLRFDDRARAVVTRAYDPAYDHILGDVHGGLVATLLDNAGWFTVAAQHPTWIVTVEYQTRLLEPAGCLDLSATGFLVRTGRRIATAQMRLQAADGRLVAIGSGTFAVTALPYPEPPAADAPPS